MTRRCAPRRVAAAAALCLALLLAASAVAAPRLHRPHRPPPPPLPTSLAVDEREWTVIPSKRVVAAGTVTLRVYNRGMDDHDLALRDSAGVLHRLELAPGGTGVIRATLAPGVHRIWCTLLAGTPDAHEGLGMVSLIGARRDPARAR